MGTSELWCRYPRIIASQCEAIILRLSNHAGLAHFRRLILPGLILITVALIFIWSPPPAMADQGDIQVVDSGAENRYPNAIRFYVTAGSADDIEEIRVFFKKTGKVTAGTYRALDFESADLVSAESFLATGRGGGYIPPGTEITYFFEIWDAAGSSYRTPGQTIVYTDPRFPWATLSSGPITIYYHGEGGEAQAQLAVDAAWETLERMAPLLGFDPSEPVRIVSYRNYNDMSAALPFRVQILEGSIRTEGIAFGDERVVLMPGFGSSARGIASHEIIHLAVAEVTGRAHNRVPAWLDEGLAEYGNLEPFAEYDDALSSGIRGDSLKALWTLDTFRGDADDIITTYGQGKSVVQHLVSNYGEGKLPELMQAIRNSFDIDQALETVYEFDQYDLDVEWRATVGLEPLAPPEKRNLLSLPSPTDTPTAIPTPTPVPTSTPVQPTPTPTLTPTSSPTPTPLPPTPTLAPTPTPVTLTPTPQATLVGSVADEDRTRQSLGCSGASSGRSALVSGDLAMIGILAGPLAMLAFRSRRRF